MVTNYQHDCNFMVCEFDITLWQARAIPPLVTMMVSCMSFHEAISKDTIAHGASVIITGMSNGDKTLQLRLQRAFVWETESQFSQLEQLKTERPS